jgi:hypothetical protein
MDANKIDGKFFITCLLAIGLIELLTGYAAGFLSGINPLWLVGVARVLEIGLIFILLILTGKGLSALGLESRGLLHGMKRGLVWSACFGAVAAVAMAILFFAGVNALKWFQMPLPGGFAHLALFFVVGGVVGPVAEEVFFRGVCYGFFRQWGMVAALILTTLLFVSAHALKTGVPLTQIVGGVVFALSFEFEKSLMVPMVIHILGNLALFSIAFFS